MFEKRKFSWLVTLVVVAFVLLSSCKQTTTPPLPSKIDEGVSQENINKWNETYKEHTRIYTIQGNVHRSAFDGQKIVNVPGVVTAVRTNSAFYIQDVAGDGDFRTSDAIYVYTPKNFKGVNVGDVVLVSGSVTEYVDSKYQDTNLTITQIKLTSDDDVVVVETGRTDLLPAPVTLTYDDLHNKVIFKDGTNLTDVLNPTEESIDWYESLEFMRVKVKNPKAVAPPYSDVSYIIPGDAPVEYTENGGVVYNEYNKADFFYLYPFGCFSSRGDAPDHELGYLLTNTLKGGDQINGDVVGIIDYYKSNYQIILTEAFPEVTPSVNTPGSVPTYDGTKLNIVSYNLENFSAGNANDSDRAAKFAEHFVNKLNSPDIICLIEIQDDNGQTNNAVVSSNETLQLLIDKIKGINPSLTYAAVNVDPSNNVSGGAPGSNIRCAYLYRTDKIELVPDNDNNTSNSTFEHGAKFVNGKLEQNPARIGVGNNSDGQPFFETRLPLVAHFRFKEGINSGKDFIVINNHLSSKGGDDAIWGPSQPVQRPSELNRHGQAELVRDFIDSVKDIPVVSVGDYNDFWFSDTLKIVKGTDMKNVVEELPLNERYTYTYSGYSQTLDHILVKGFSDVKGGVLHVNSIVEADKQLSDHDPVWAQLTF